MNELTEPVPLHCANCGTPMQGEFCHHCGQSVHSVLKPMHHLVEDTLDMVLHVDSRIVHTLPPLLFKPGFLTLEYFSGRRQRYVAPFRLMFVLCLLAFFVAHLALGDAGIAVGRDAVTVQTGAFKQAKTPAEVDRALQEQLAGLDQTQRLPAVGALTREQLEQARRDLRQEAIKRRAELGDKGVVMLGPSAEAPHGADGGTRRTPDDPVQLALNAPVRIGWLPDFLNARLDRMVKRMGANWNAITGDGERAVEARHRLEGQMFATLPQTLFFMLPLFALLLKLLYVFRRRLYMEHLIVALHSHAFLFLAMLLGVLIDLLGAWLIPLAGWLASPLHWLGWGLVLWVPVYLLIMQKRIYRQGWPMTLLKYLVAGCCYLWLLSAVAVAAFMLSLGY